MELKELKNDRDAELDDLRDAGADCVSPLSLDSQQSSGERRTHGLGFPSQPLRDIKELHADVRCRPDGPFNWFNDSLALEGIPWHVLVKELVSFFFFLSVFCGLLWLVASYTGWQNGSEEQSRR